MGGGKEKSTDRRWQRDSRLLRPSRDQWLEQGLQPLVGLRGTGRMNEWGNELEHGARELEGEGEEAGGDFLVWHGVGREQKWDWITWELT